MERDREPWELQLTREQWAKFVRVMELCSQLKGAPVTPAECLGMICKSYLERRGIKVPPRPDDPPE